LNRRRRAEKGEELDGEAAPRRGRFRLEGWLAPINRRRSWPDLFTTLRETAAPMIECGASRLRGWTVEHDPVMHTTRRKFLAGIAATLAPGPLAAQAQPRDGMRRLGVLMSIR